MNETRILLAALAASLLAACSPGGDAGQRPPLAGSSLGGPFALTSHEGRRVTQADFEGRYRIVYFGFTFCPDVCPTDMQVIGAGLRRFEQMDAQRAARVVPIFVTTDPARDTPEALAGFVGNFHPRFVGLTGTEQEIADTARRYGIYYRKAGPPDARDYLVDHSRMAVLYGPDGAPLAILPHDQGPEAFAAALDRWVG